MRRIALPLGLLIALIASNGWWLFHDAGHCSSFLYHEVDSPDGARGVFLLYENCGATTSYSTLAVLWPTDRRFPNSGYQPFLVLKGLYALDTHIRWISKDRVVVDLPAGVETFRREVVVDGVSITYR